MLWFSNISCTRNMLPGWPAARPALPCAVREMWCSSGEALGSVRSEGLRTRSWGWVMVMVSKYVYYIYIIIYMCIIQCCVSWLITVSLDIYHYLYLSNYVWYYDMILMSLVVSPTRISESLIFTCVTCQATHTLARMAWARVPVWHSSMALSYARTNRKGVLLAELRGVGNPDDEFQRSRNFLGQNLAWWF